MLLKIICRAVLPLAASSLILLNCAKGESAFLEIDFSDVSDWKYLLGANIYGESDADDPSKNFTGSLRAYLQGLPDQSGGVSRFGLRDVTLIAPFFEQEERDDIEKRLTELEVSVNKNNITLSDTIGIPGVLTGGWDIMRCLTRVMPVMPNAKMKVGSSWEREQRFPITVDQGQADGLLYQLFTLDSIYKTQAGTSAAAFNWVFTYRVSTPDGGGAGAMKYPLSGNGKGSAVLDLEKKKLLKSQASFQVTHSQKPNAELNEVVHFEMID